MASIAPSIPQPPVNDVQHGSSPHLNSSILAPDSPIPSSLYEDDEDASISASILSSSLPASPWYSLPLLDEPLSGASPMLPALTMPAASPRLSYSASADSFLPSSHSVHPTPHNSNLTPVPATITLPFAAVSASARPAVLTIGGIHIPTPPPLVADPAAFPPAPVIRASTTVELDDDSSSDDGVQVLRTTVKRKRTIHEQREQRRRLRQQQSASSASPSPQPAHSDQEIIDAEAEAAADIVDLTSDNHPLLAPPTAPQPVLPPVEVPVEPPSPPVPKHMCPICLSAAEELASLKCGHVFCVDCLRTTVQLNHRCPTCRAKATLRDIRRLYM